MHSFPNEYGHSHLIMDELSYSILCHIFCIKHSNSVGIYYVIWFTSDRICLFVFQEIFNVLGIHLSCVSNIPQGFSGGTKIVLYLPREIIVFFPPFLLSRQIIVRCSFCSQFVTAFYHIKQYLKEN